jgi:uncharacterized protein (TIRG00374 family)
VGASSDYLPAQPGSGVQPSDADGGGAGRRRSFWARHRRAVGGTIGVVVAAGFVYYVLPRLAGLGPTLRLLRHGDVWWLALGVVLEALAYVGAIVLFRGVFGGARKRIGWRASSEISIAGAAATKVVATAGAGGIALTVWALRGYGLSGAEVADGLVCDGIGVTLVPAIFATCVIVIVLSMLFVYEPAESFLTRRAERCSGRASKWWRRVAALPRSIHAGLLDAIAMVKRRDPSVFGAVASWGFDIAVLWASFRAFGHSPPGAVLVMSYYVGTLANVLPMLGGIGGVEGGMIGTFFAFGVQRHLAVLAVLAYRTISYWLPAVPGALAYWQLRRQLKGSPTSGAPTEEGLTHEEQARSS